eukprot:350149-Chlamydomonas_euryale.AAC.6
MSERGAGDKLKEKLQEKLVSAGVVAKVRMGATSSSGPGDDCVVTLQSQKAPQTMPAPRLIACAAQIIRSCHSGR